MANYAITIAAVAALLAGWVAVQAAYRRFARRHPQHGACRDEQAGGCGACASPHSCTADLRPGAPSDAAQCARHRAAPHNP